MDSDNHATSGQRLSGKVALVTGGAMGFGYAMTKRFVAEGAKVVVMDLDGQDVEGTLGVDRVCVVAGDVTKRETWERALEAAKSRFGALHILVNNAGVTRNSPAHELEESQFDLMVAIHQKALFHSVQVIFPHFLSTGDGRVINIASTGATRPRPGFVWYNMTKGAIVVATKSLAVEYAPKIRVNCIVPAIGNTNMLLTSFGGRKPEPSEMDWVYKMIPMQRITEPEDVANAALFLVSDEAGFVTGTVLDVDGGRGI